MNLVRATEPFKFDDLFQLALKNMGSGDKHPDLGAPLLVDLRAVNLIKLDAEDVRALVRKRMSFGTDYSNNPSVFVGGDDGSFGMLRMYAAYAEVAGLRAQENMLVTLDMQEAVDWILPRLNAPRSSRSELLKLVI